MNHNCELTKNDLKVFIKALDGLDDLSPLLPYIEEVEIHITTEGGDTVVVGYGESAEPAILQIQPRKVENVQKFDSRVPATSFGQ